MNQKPYHTIKIFLILCIIILFLVWINPVHFFSPIRSSLIAIFLPIENVSSAIGYNLRSLGDFFTSLGNLRTQNSILRQENLTLQSKLALYDDVFIENNKLRHLIDLLPQHVYNFSAAEIITYDPTGNHDWFLINKGSHDGIRVDMPILAYGTTLVGVVKDVQSFTSRVETLTSQKSIINAVVSNSDIKGVARGLSGIGVLFDQVEQKNELLLNKEIITSGIGGRLPRGLLIGSVVGIDKTSDGLFQQARIELAADPMKERFVFFIQ